MPVSDATLDLLSAALNDPEHWYSVVHPKTRSHRHPLMHLRHRNGCLLTTSISGNSDSRLFDKYTSIFLLADHHNLVLAPNAHGVCTVSKHPVSTRMHVVDIHSTCFDDYTTQDHVLQAFQRMLWISTTQDGQQAYAHYVRSLQSFVLQHYPDATTMVFTRHSGSLYLEDLETYQPLRVADSLAAYWPVFGVRLSSEHAPYEEDSLSMFASVFLDKVTLPTSCHARLSLRHASFNAPVLPAWIRL